jgi:hypothetical protein
MLRTVRGPGDGARRPGLFPSFLPKRWARGFQAEVLDQR